MAQDDPFTLDLFGNTALSSGLDLGVTAFAGGLTARPDHDDDPDPSTPPPTTPVAAAAVSSARRARGANFHLAGDRTLAKGWKDRARDNIAAIGLAAAIEADERPATLTEQEQLIRFTGFGASELANYVFRRPGEAEFRKGWEAIGSDLEERSAISTMPRSRAAPSTRISRPSSSSEPFGQACSVWAGAAAACSSPASARGCFLR
ncbi:hypothetical protein ACVIWV_010201 [Bradyrhizobium diazoefficiens]